MSAIVRPIAVPIHLDTSELDAKAPEAAKKMGSILSSVKDDKGALAAAKAKVDQLVASVSASGRKLSVPMEQFTASVKTTSAALQQLSAGNSARIEMLIPKLDRLKQHMLEAWNAGKSAKYDKFNFEAKGVESELNTRLRLDTQIRAQMKALDQLNSKVGQSGDAAKKAATASGTLARQSAECKKRMQELAAAGQQNSKEYQAQAAKAKELAKSMQQVNSDAKPDAHVRLRTALMNAKQAMVEAEREFGRGSIQFQQARDEATRLQQAMNGMNKQIKNLSSPVATYQGIINGLSGISGAASVATGAMSLFGDESQVTAKAMAKLQSIMSITMGLQSLSMVLNKNSAVQLNLIGKLTTWWAVCKAKAAAAIAAETAATTANTGATAANAAVTKTATTANMAHAASWKAVGIAIKSIPVFGWIIAGITALVAGIRLLYKATHKLTAAQAAMQGAMAKAYPEMIKEKLALDMLYKTATDANKPLKERLTAIARLKQQYPSYFQQLKNEAILAGKAATAYDLLAEAIKRKAIAAGMEEQLKEEGQKLSKWLDDHKEEENWLNDNKPRYQELSKKYTSEQVTAATQKAARLMQTSLFGTWKTLLTPAELEMIEIDTYEKRDNHYKKAYKKDNKKTLESIDYLTRTQSKFTDETEEEKRAQTPGDPLYYLRKMEEARNLAENRSIKATDAERKQARRDYEKWEKLYNKSLVSYKGNASALGNADIAEQKIEDVEIKSERERDRRLTDLRRQLEQQRINVMSEGAAKRERQRLLDNQKEQDSLDRQMQSDIEAEVNRQKALWDAKEEANAKAAAAQGKQYRKRAFSSGDILSFDFNPGDTSKGVASGSVDTAQIDVILAKYGLLQDVMLQAQSQRLEKQQAAERLAMDEYLRQYGTMQEKREAIDRVYADRKSKATSQGEAMQIQQEWNAALNDIEFDDFVQNRAALAFGEVENLSNATIGELIDELEKYRSKVVATFDPEKISKYEEALSRLKKAQAMNADNPLSAFIPEYFKEKKAAQAELNAAEKVSNQLTEQKAEKEREVAGQIQKIIDKVKKLTGLEITPAHVKDGTTLDAIVGNLANQGKKDAAAALQGEINALGNMQVGLNNVSQAAGEAAGNYQELLSQFGFGFSGANGSLAAVDAIVHKINENVQSAAELLHDLSNTADALGADTEVGSGWDKATTIMDAFAEASQGATNAFDSFKSGNAMGVIQGVVQSFTAWIRGFAALHDKSRERTIQRLQEQVDELDRINKRIDRQAGKQYSREASDSYERMMANNRRQIDLIQQQIDAERDKKKTDDDRIQEWEDQIEELRNQIEDYKDAALDAIIGEDISTSIDNFAEKMADSWGNTKQAARDARQYVKDMLRQMVIEAMKTDLSDPVRRLRAMMSRAMNDGVVTDAEQKGMEDFAKKMAEDMQRRYDWASDILDTAESGQSGGDRGGFATASQDSVDELNGRFAAMHTSIEMARQSLGTIQIDTSGIRAQLAEQNRIAQEARSMHVTAIGHLETISKNTKQLYEMNERLAQIEKNTKGL